MALDVSYVFFLQMFVSLLILSLLLLLSVLAQTIVHGLVLDLRMPSIEIHIDGNIQITPIALVGFTRDFTLQSFPGANGNGITQIKHGLLPMRIPCKWCRRKANRLVYLCKGTFKVGHETVHIVVALRLQAKFGRKGQIFLGAC
jgi:hypothetical protein